MIDKEPPNGSRIEWEYHTDLYAAWRDDEEGKAAGYETGDGAPNWVVYPGSVPVTWEKLNNQFENTPREFGVLLLPHPYMKDIRLTWPTKANRQFPKNCISPSKCHKVKAKLDGDTINYTCIWCGETKDVILQE